jgi:hypothetical protein
MFLIDSSHAGYTPLRFQSRTHLLGLDNDGGDEVRVGHIEKRTEALCTLLPSMRYDFPLMAD